MTDDQLMDTTSPLALMMGYKSDSGFITNVEKHSIPDSYDWLTDNDFYLPGVSKDASLLMDANDRTDITELEREMRVAEIFAKHGGEVTFVD